jgi:hypothetical protein
VRLHGQEEQVMARAQKLCGAYRCQFCERESPAREWKDDKCPECGREYDAMLAQEEDDG